MEFRLSNLDLYFRVASAKLWYGDGPLTSLVETGPNVLQLELEPESGDFDSTLTCARQREFSRLFRDRSLSAFIHSHPSGWLERQDGTRVKGTLSVGGDGTTGIYGEIGASLRKESFDSVAFLLINGGNDLISRCLVLVGLDKPPDKIDFKKREDTLRETQFAIERLAIRFEVGEQRKDSENA
jgi:hypothetical protein